MLSKPHRISNKSEISKIFSLGYKARGKYGMLIGSQQNDDCYKLCIVVKKEFGKATVRNKIRRQISSIIYDYNKTVPLGRIKFIYVTYSVASEFKDLKNEVDSQLSLIIKKLGESDTKVSHS